MDTNETTNEPEVNSTIGLVNGVEPIDLGGLASIWTKDCE